jgi:hypothetical protein
LNFSKISEFKNSFNTVVISSVLHEIDWPYGRNASNKVLHLAHNLLRRDGVLVFRDGVKPGQKTEEIEVTLKTPYANEKFYRFITEYRQRPIKFSYVHRSNSRICISSYDLHDVLCKYYFEGELWERDMNEVFGTMSESEYHELIGKYFKIVHSETYVAPYLKELWNRDFEIINGVDPVSHILIVAKNTRFGFFNIIKSCSNQLEKHIDAFFKFETRSR